MSRVAEAALVRRHERLPVGGGDVEGADADEQDQDASLSATIALLARADSRVPRQSSRRSASDDHDRRQVDDPRVVAERRRARSCGTWIPMLRAG